MKFGIAVLIFIQALLLGRELSSGDSTSLTSNEIRLYSDVTIDSSQVSVNTIRILGGSLNVYGTVEGQITVVGGDIHIFPSAIVNGTIILIGGEIHRDPNAQIIGNIIDKPRITCNAPKIKKTVLLLSIVNKTISVSYTHLTLPTICSV